MESPPRGAGRGSRPKRSDEEYVLFLQGIPAHCRWQELKDMVRQSALHIRQAVVYDDQYGFPTGIGQIIVKNEDEAWRTYHRLSTLGWNGQTLVVTLARTSSPTRPIAGPTKSSSPPPPPPSLHPPPRSVIPSTGHVPGYSTPPRRSGSLTSPASPLSPVTPITPASPPSWAAPEYIPLISSPNLPHHPPPHETHFQPFPSIFTDPSMNPHFYPHLHHGMPYSPILQPHSHSHLFDPLPLGFGPFLGHHPPPPPPPPPPPAPPMQSLYAHHHFLTHKTSEYSFQNHVRCSPPQPTHLPKSPPRHRVINVQGIITNNNNRNEEGRIHVNELELVDYFRAAGKVERCEIHSDKLDHYHHRTTGRPRLYANVTFHTADEARRAVRMYNGACFKGWRLNVGVDDGDGVVLDGMVAGDGRDGISSKMTTMAPGMVNNMPRGAVGYEGSNRGLQDKTHSKQTVRPEGETRMRRRTVEYGPPLVVNGSGNGVVKPVSS